MQQKVQCNFSTSWRVICFEIMFVLNTPLLYVQCNSSLVVPGERKKTYPHISQYVNVWEEATFILLRCSRSGAHTPPILVCIFFWFVKKVKTRNKISRSLKVLTNEGEKVTFHMCIDIFYTSLILSLKVKKNLIESKKSTWHDFCSCVLGHTLQKEWKSFATTQSCNHL